MTAITGFGFHLQKFRPVAKKEVVEKLGLKENPSPVCSLRFFCLSSQQNSSRFVSSRLNGVYIFTRKTS
jgi:hypothetical protein